MHKTTDERLAELMDLRDAATPGPWCAVLGSGNNVCTGVSGNDTNGPMVADVCPQWFLDDGCSATVGEERGNLQLICSIHEALSLAEALKGERDEARAAPRRLKGDK